MWKTKILFFWKNGALITPLEKVCGKGTKIQIALKSGQLFYLLFEDVKKMKIISEILLPSHNQ